MATTKPKGRSWLGVPVLLLGMIAGLFFWSEGKVLTEINFPIIETRSLSDESGMTVLQNHAPVKHPMEDEQQVTAVFEKRLDRTKSVDAASTLLRGPVSATKTIHFNQTTNENKDMVHLITSKILMYQPERLALGNAQLELFRRVHLQSLQQQTSKNFYLFVRTDPDLDPSLKEPLLRILQESGVRHVLVAQNRPKDTFDLAFEDLHVTKMVSKADVWSGDWDEFAQYLGSSTRVIETWLDCDDALDKEFVETIQEHALATFSFERHLYKWICAGKYLDWSVNNLLELNYEPDSPGIIYRRHADRCVSAGWSAVFSAEDIESRNFPIFSRNHYYVLTPENRNKRLCKKKEANGCVDLLEMPNAVMRGRTPTSMFMESVGANMTSRRDMMKKQGKRWRKVANRFGFNETDGRFLFQHFEKNVRDIVWENYHACQEKRLMKCPWFVRKKILAVIKMFSKE